jgi:hypothetical protein
VAGARQVRRCVFSAHRPSGLMQVQATAARATPLPSSRLVFRGGFSCTNPPPKPDAKPHEESGEQSAGGQKRPQTQKRGKCGERGRNRHRCCDRSTQAALFSC